MSYGSVTALLTGGRIIEGVDKDTKSLVHCDVGPQYECYIATLIHYVHIWVKVHSSNYTQVKRTKSYRTSFESSRTLSPRVVGRQAATYIRIQLCIICAYVNNIIM